MPAGGTALSFFELLLRDASLSWHCCGCWTAPWRQVLQLPSTGGKQSNCKLRGTSVAGSSAAPRQLLT